jgi:eukaryotic-like serine/threonine-protein kinase
MPLQPGSRLGPYELVAPIGAGGMGEVWRGRDTRLDRSVAVKVLPPAFAEDEDRKARFEREAKAISSLNHPHICTLFDVSRDGESHFLVMELLEGESLADRLQRGPLPLDQVVKVGAQVAEALDAAHRQGVVHRDLKPGNVTLTKAGAKLLDFGLARTGVAGDAVSGSTEMATEAKPLTTAGTVLGTFQYMAPEQLEGRDADARTDIFALGALLYEMATGRRAFDGKSRTSLIAAILASQPPPISSVQPVMPPALDHVVRRCLEKDPEDRWQSARDVASELRWIAEAGSQAGVPATLSVRRRSRERIAWTLAALLAAATLGALSWAVHLRGALRGESRVFRSDLAAPPEVPVSPVVQGALALSPDGRSLAFVSGGEAQSGLAVRDLEGGETRRLAGTAGGTFPFWSPDSRWLAFFADGRLKKVEATGGPVQALCEAAYGRGGTWGRDGTIVFAPDITGPLARVSAGGGIPAPVTSTDAPDMTHRNPWFLPDGRHFLFTSRDTGSAAFASVAVGSVDGGTPRVLLERGSNPQYADGHLFTVVDGNLVAQRFDPGSQSLAGQPAPLAGGVEFYNPRDLAQYSVSPSGLVAYRRTRLRETQLVWVDRSGRELSKVGEPAHHSSHHLGADGRALAVVRTDAAGADADVWILDLPRAQPTRATFASSPSLVTAVLSPDGARLAVSAATAGWQGATLWVQPVSGSGSRQPLLDRVAFTVDDWSPDGSLLLGSVQQAGSGFDVAWVALADPSRVVHLTTSRFNEWAGAFSPDGRLVAYHSNETGRNEVFLSDFPAAARKWQVSRTGGQNPAWRGDGRELYFTDAERAFAVSVSERGGSLELGAPTRLPFSGEEFDLGMRPGGGRLAVRSPDGQRFLLARFGAGAVTEPVRLVRSWRRLVERQAPAGW